MKKSILLSLFLVISIVYGYSQIWCNPFTLGRPIANNYLGDKLSTSWYFNFEIGQALWNAAEVGVGQNADGSTGWNWASASWYQDNGSNRYVHRDIGNFQFTATGTWYAVGRAKANSADAWTYADEGGWSNNTALTASTSTGFCPYFTVNALGNPTSCTATISGTTATLGWTKFTGTSTYNVMIVRYAKNATPTAPVNTTSYALNATIGTGTVVYATNNGTSTTNTVTAATDYDYYFYSENWNYYSAGVKVTALAPAGPNITGISSSLPASSSTQTYKGATITVTGTNLGSVTTVKLGGSGGTTIAGATIGASQITFVVPDGILTGTVYVSDGTNTSTSSGSLANLGYLTSAATDWNTASTWLGGAVPAASSNVTIANNITLNATATNNPTTITVNASSAITFGGSGAVTVSGTLTNGGSIVMTSGGTLTLGSGSTLANGSATFTGGTGTVAFAGSGTITGTTGFNNVTLAGGVTFSSASTINGTLTINAGGYVNTTAPIYANGSTLKYNSGTSYGRGTEWSTTSGNGYPCNVQISGTTLLGIGANSGTGTARQCSGNLTVDAGCTLSMNETGWVMTAAVTVNGNVVNNGTITLSGSVGGDLKTQGNINDSGTFNANSRAIFFNGGNNQVIQGTGVFDISYVRISKTGGSVQLATNLTCAGPGGGNAMEIDGTNSMLDLNGYTLYLGASGVGSTYNSGIATPGKIKGSSTSSLSILGTGALGTINFDQTTPGTTNALSSLTINRTLSGTVTFGTNATVSGALTLTSGKLAIGANTLTLAGTVASMSADNSLTGSATSSLIINGTGALGTLYFDQTTGGTTNALQNLTINRTSSGTVTLGNDATVSGALTLTSGKPAIGATTLTLAGTVASMSAANSLTGSASSNLTINGTGALGTLYFDQTTPGTTNKIAAFTLNRTSSGTATLASNLSAGSLTLTAGAFTINPAIALTATGTTALGAAQCLVLKSDATGTASFIDNGTISGSGTAKIERYLTPYIAGATTDWRSHFISSPVGTAQAIMPEFQTMTNATDDFFMWDETTGYWINTKQGSASPFTWNTAFGAGNGAFVTGKGYLAAYPATATKNFTGTPYTSTGGLTMTCTNNTAGGGWNLLGNPFPSAIDWDLVSKGNGMDNALYYYDNSAPRYRYYVALTGGIGTSYSGGSRYIPAMQGFMVHAKTTGTQTITMANSNRVHQSLTTYYKAAPLTENVLNISVEGNGSSDDLRVCFFDQAGVNFDGDYDAYKLFSSNTTIPELYSVTPDNTQLAINTLPLSQMYGDVPVGFQPGTAGSFTFTADGVSSFAAATCIYLEDKKAGTMQKLNDNPVYAFTSDSGDNTDRFLLHFQNATSITNPDIARDFTIRAENGIITIQQTGNQGGAITVTDMAGRTVAGASLLAGQPSRIAMDGHTGLFIVSILTANGVSSSRIFVK